MDLYYRTNTPAPPRQIKSDEKTPPPSSLVLAKQSNPVNFCNVNTTKEISNEDNDQTLLIQTSPPTLTNGHSRIGKTNSLSNRYTLANSQPTPYLVKQTSSDSKFLNTSKSFNDLHRVLFIIDANPCIVQTKLFANISPFSNYPDEFEILFMIGSINIHRNNQQI